MVSRAADLLLEPVLLPNAIFALAAMSSCTCPRGLVFKGFDQAESAASGCLARLAGHGFGDAVIAVLLRSRGLLPAPAHAVVVMGDAMRPAVCAVAACLRAAQRRVALEGGEGACSGRSSRRSAA